MPPSKQLFTFGNRIEGPNANAEAEQVKEKGIYQISVQIKHPDSQTRETSPTQRGKAGRSETSSSSHTNPSLLPLRSWSILSTPCIVCIVHMDSCRHQGHSVLRVILFFEAHLHAQTYRVACFAHCETHKQQTYAY